MTEATTPTPNPTPLWLIVRLQAYKYENSTYVFTIRSATAAATILYKRVVPRANMLVTYNNDHTKVISQKINYI